MTGREKRISGEIVDIDYAETRRFFEDRADCAAEACEWTRILYQDDNPELAGARDRFEKEIVLPELHLGPTHRLLDVGCGVGRWALATIPRIDSYLGTDFSEGLLERARDEFRACPQAQFMRLAAEDVEQLLVHQLSFHRVILAGILVYLNDDDVRRCLRGVARLCSESDAIVYIREPMALSSRLTLSKYWSEQLNAEYSAIYRSRDEYEQIFRETLCEEGFQIQRFSPLYPPELENRAETSQFVVLLHRGQPAADS